MRGRVRPGRAAAADKVYFTRRALDSLSNHSPNGRAELSAPRRRKPHLMAFVGDSPFKIYQPHHNTAIRAAGRFDVRHRRSGERIAMDG